MESKTTFLTELGIQTDQMFVFKNNKSHQSYGRTFTYL